MPKIATYDAPEGLGLRPTEVGISAVAAAARRVQGEYNEAAAAQAGTGERFGSAIKVAGDVAVKYLDHRQISQGAPALAGLMAGKTKQWDDAVKDADPNDPTIAPKFMEGLEKDLEQFKSGFWTENAQKWAETHADSFRQHMSHKTTSDLSRMAAEAEVINQDRTVNNLALTVRGDPSSLDQALSTWQGSHQAGVATSNIGAEHMPLMMKHMEGGNKRIVEAAVQGYIEKTGEVPSWISDPKYSKFINQAEVKSFQQTARMYDRLAKSEDRTNRVQAREDAKLDFNDKMNQLEAGTMPKNVGDPPRLPNDYWSTLEKLVNHPGAALDPTRFKTMVENGEKITIRLEKPEPLARASHEVWVDLTRRMRATDESRLTSDKEIYDNIDNLTKADFNDLRKEYAAMRTPAGEALAKDRGEFFKTYALTIDASRGPGGIEKPSALGQQKLYAAEQDARRQEGVLRSKGLDPHLLYDPNSEYFLGKQISKYRASLQEIADYDKKMKTEDTARFKNRNLTGPGKEVISIDVKDIPPTWLFSPSRNQYRDPATGKVYDSLGREVK